MTYQNLWYTVKVPNIYIRKQKNCNVSSYLKKQEKKRKETQKKGRREDVFEVS